MVAISKNVFNVYLICISSSSSTVLEITVKLSGLTFNEGEEEDMRIIVTHSEIKLY